MNLEDRSRAYIWTKKNHCFIPREVELSTRTSIGKRNSFSYKAFFYTILSYFALGVAIYYFISSGIHYQISDYIFPSQKIEAIFNSNQLFLPYFYQDTFIHHFPLSDWTFSSVPFFFPDGLIYFIIVSLIHHPLSAVLLSNAVILICYYLLIISIGTYLNGSASKNLFRLSALLCISLGSSHLRDNEIMLPLWSSHFGATILIFLLSLLLILKILNDSFSPKKWIYGSLLLCIGYITSFSDPFYFVLLVSSIFGGLLALSLHKRISYKLAIGLFLTISLFSALGFLTNCYDWLDLHIRSFFNIKLTVAPSIFHSFIQPMNTLHKIFSLYYAYNPTIIIFSLGIIIVGIIFLFHGTPLNNNIFFIIICITFCLLSTVFSTLFLDKDILRSHSLSLRHFQPFMLLPTFLCLPIFLSQYTIFIDFINRYYVYFIILLIGCLVLFQPIQTPKNMLSIYPPVTQCLDYYAKKGKLFNKNGVSAYWDAHENNMLSKENIHMVALNRYKNPYNWMSTRHDYKDKTFYFALVRESTFSKASVISTWGKPDTILDCPQTNDYQVFVYNAGFQLQGLSSQK